jgi:tagatose 1,6-diphosphate aldolase
MKQRVVSLGKYRALQRASTPQGHFTILALDHSDALRRALNPAAPQTVTIEEMIAFKTQVIRALAPETSGVLLDPIYGAAQAIAGSYLDGAGMLVELEKADYALQPMPLNCELLPEWSVAKIKRMGADGVKLFFYYNVDDEAHTSRQDKLIRRVTAQCAAHDIPLYAEPILYPIGEDDSTYAHQFSRRTIEAARRISALGVDVLKMEFPAPPSRLDDAAFCRDACARLTKSIDVPWVLLSAGVTYKAFCRQVEIACASGASGYIVGRAVWGEVAQIDDISERQRWLDETGRARLRELAAHAARGRAWTEWLDCEPVNTDWYRTYGASGDTP